MKVVLTEDEIMEICTERVANFLLEKDREIILHILGADTIEKQERSKDQHIDMYIVQSTKEIDEVFTKDEIINYDIHS